MPELFERAVADAVEAWAEQRYSALQHVDPGRLLVRTPRGDVESWDVSARVVFVTKYNRALETGGTAPEGRDAK